MNNCVTNGNVVFWFTKRMPKLATFYELDGRRGDGLRMQIFFGFLRKIGPRLTFGSGVATTGRTAGASDVTWCTWRKRYNTARSGISAVCVSVRTLRQRLLFPMLHFYFHPDALRYSIGACERCRC